MTKTIMALAVAAILIAGTFSLGSAFAIDEGDQFKIKTKKGPMTCTTSGGESCGDGKAKAQFRLLVTDVDGQTALGNAQGVIQIRSDEGTKIQITTNGLYQYDTAGRIITTLGIGLDGKGNDFTISATGDVGEFKKNKADIDLSITLTNTETGDIFNLPELGGVVLTPVSS